MFSAVKPLMIGNDAIDQGTVPEVSSLKIVDRIYCPYLESSFNTVGLQKS